MGVLFAALLASPFVLGLWSDHAALDGKTQVWTGESAQSRRELAKCLIRREAGGPSFEFVSQDHLLDPASGLAVVIGDDGARRTVGAWLPPGRQIGPGEARQLEACLAR